MNWPKVRVGDVAEQIRGVSYDKGEASAEPKPGLIPLLRANNITEDGLSFADLVYVPEQRVNERQKLRQNDIVITASSGSRDVVGRAAILDREYDGSFGAFCKALRPTDRVHPRFFAHYFKTSAYRRMVSSLAAGININNLRNEHLDDLELPLPSLAEQERIAAILDAADALRTKRRAAIAKLDELAQSIFIEMFGGDRSVPKRIRELLEDGTLELHKDGNHGSQYPRAEEFGVNGIPFLSAQSIDESGYLDLTKIQRLSEEKARRLRIGWLKAGDVLLAHNASVGAVAIYEGQFPEAIIGTSLTAFRPNIEKLTSEYLAAALRSSSFQAQLVKNMGQTTRNQVPITAQRDLVIPLPNLEKQRQFSRQLSILKAVVTADMASKEKLSELFLSLQHRAFKGEL